MIFVIVIYVRYKKNEIKNIIKQHERKIEMKTDQGKNNDKTLNKLNQILNRRYRIWHTMHPCVH